MRTLPHIATVVSAPAEVAVFNPFNSMGGGGILFIIKAL
jgi:hypothetical protein